MTREKVEQLIVDTMQGGKWFTASNLRQLFNDNPDTFWAAMSALYKAKVIERAFDMYGVTIYRLNNDRN
jgi:hypothetical protein